MTATILDSRIIPAVSLTGPSKKGPPGIEFTTNVEIIPLSVEIYAYVEFAPCGIKFCGPFPCGFKWCTLLKLTIAEWSMREIVIKGPGMRLNVPDSTPPIAGSVVAFQTSASSVSIDWLGFFEEDSEIFSYEVCVGSGVDESDFMSCVDVGLANSFQGQHLQIPHGAVATVKIWFVYPTNIPFVF